MTTPTPSSLSRFCRTVLPQMVAASDGKRTLKTIDDIQATDQYNSFDRFHDTSQTLVDYYQRAGAGAEITPIQTGGDIGTGRWIIQEAQDVHSATVDVVAPVRQRIIDFKENPWHVVQWSSATPKQGLHCELVVIDDLASLSSLRPGALRGKAVLTRGNIRGTTMKQLAHVGAAVVITDIDVTNNPDALAWTKFGWGMVPMSHATARIVGLVMSTQQGDRLRRLHQRHGGLQLRVKVDVRKYVGHHDMVSGLIRGSEDPQDEIWAIAHSGEPGAIDNASGCAVTVEIAQIIEGLIAKGTLRRPRRTIRLLNAYECYGFFAYLEREHSLQTPMAGVCIDTVGAKPSVCGGRLEWHATIPSSAGFVDWIGEKILRATLGNYKAAGYKLCMEDFMSTSDTLIGDPQYGYPCPWITTHHKEGKGSTWDAYHSSADQLNLLSAAGMKTCSVSMAAYLYWLADMDTTSALQVAKSETKRLTDVIDTSRRRLDRAGADYIAETHEVGMQRLQRFLWGGDRAAIQQEIGECRAQMSAAAAQVKKQGPKRRLDASARRVPRRTALLAPTTENVEASIGSRLSQARLSQWSLYWADGRRTVAEIADRISWEWAGLLAPRDGGGPRPDVSAERVAGYFEALADLDYVELPEQAEMVSRRDMVDDLRALGITAGMDVMVHSSLSKIGDVAGGGATVVEALVEAVGSRGTVLAPSFNHKAAQVYNPLTTPTTNGAIADALWRHPRAARSMHATHAVAAIGAKADHYVADHLHAGIWSEDSPIGKLVHGDGYLLALGVTHWTTTAYHVAECSMPCGCIDPFGNVDRVVTEQGSVEEVWGLAFRSGECPVEISPKLDSALDRRGLQRRGKVGDADCELVRASDLWKVRREHLRGVCRACKVKPRYRND